MTATSRGQQINTKYKHISKVVHMFLPEIQSKIISLSASAQISILADCQHGFRSQRSCETQLVQFYHDMVSNLDGARDRGQKQTDVIIMDFAKAFDTGGYCTN